MGTSKAGSAEDGAEVFGSEETPLLECTLGALVEEQAVKYGDRDAVVVSWQNHRSTYKHLAERSKLLAKAMLEMGLRHGDCIGIQAGNCYEYIEVFLGGARIGCPVVVLNNTYTPEELANAVARSNCVLLFLATSIGPKDQTPHIERICSAAATSQTQNQTSSLPDLRRLVLLTEDLSKFQSTDLELMSYHAFTLNGLQVFVNESMLRRAEKKVQPSDVLTLQFTSGTTGAPKAAMLTHRNMVNNGLLVGDRMEFTSDDILCCPPPLFHCFGLTMGFLGTCTHGSCIVFPSDGFNGDEVLDSLVTERCTTVYGVPTMFVSTLEANKLKPRKLTTLEKGLAAGAPVPMAILKHMQNQLGIKEVLIAYGMTETSPVTCMTAFQDTLEQKLRTIGRVMPHTGCKIIDRKGRLARRGQRGEICTSGYALQKGYWKNEAKTAEAMLTDDRGILWMHTGDEGAIDDEGFVTVTGRIKDIIIRGGENIFPTEIEERLLAHTSISESSVVGLPDEKYGEVVAAFVKQQTETARLSLNEISDWVKQTLGRHKAPVYAFWIGDEEVGSDFPKTGSGKHQKHILRALGKQLLEKKGNVRSAKL